MSENWKENQEKDFTNDPYKDEPFSSRRRSRHNPSLFGPIVLIAIGVLFLLNNLGMLPGLTLNWVAAVRLWPLLLILIGINIVVRQAPRPLGGLLSAIVGLIAVAIFGYVLLFSPGGVPVIGGFPAGNQGDVQTREISFPATDLQGAKVELDFGTAGAHVGALEDSPSLIEGEVSYIGDLTFDTSTSGSQASVFLRENNAGLWWLNPGNWGTYDLGKWQLGLSPRVPLDLRLNAGAGSVDLDLSELTLQALNFDGGAGSTEMTLPDGDYDATVDAGAGSATVNLGENGRQQIEIDGGVGSININLPSNREVRVTVDSGVGSFNLNGRQFDHVSGDDNDGVWETNGYQNAADPLDLIIDVGVGSVNIGTR